MPDIIGFHGSDGNDLLADSVNVNGFVWVRLRVVTHGVAASVLLAPGDWEALCACQIGPEQPTDAKPEWWEQDGPEHE
jgi:hypothetical protein